MKQSTRPRKTAKLSKSLSHNLNMYALAASAAGVSALVLAQPAEAKIIYTKANVVIGPNQEYTLYLRNNGEQDFVFYNSSEATRPNPIGSFTLSVVPFGENAALSNAARLKPGSQVGRNIRGFETGRQQMYRFWYSSGASWHSGHDGAWGFNTSGYLGLKFFISGQAHYGWASFTMGDDAQRNRSPNQYSIRATLTGYAYESVPNKPIIAGKTKGSDVITVEPGTLGGLALGRK